MIKPLPTHFSMLLFAALFCPASEAAGSMAADQGAGGAFFLSRDNEDFITRRLALEYLPDFQHGDSLTGVRYTYHTYTQQDWQRQGQQVSLLQRHLDPATTNGWQLDAGLFRQGGHDLLTLDGGYRLPLADRTSLEVFVN